MPKNQTIAWILALLVLVTLINLYANPHLRTTAQQPLQQWFQDKVNHPVARRGCALQGIECPSSPEPCDCKALCGEEFVPFQVLEGDRLYVMDRKLAPGAYCLPKGVDQCNLKTSRHIFSLSGWSCLSDGGGSEKRAACQNEEALDNALNVLWDTKTDAEVGTVEDYYERYQGKLRYECRCGSRALDQTPMISPFPFMCLPDYCLRGFEYPLPSMGWNGRKCECGPYPHLYAWNEQSPCRREVTRLDQHELVGRVECMTQESFVKRPLICPTDDGVVVFKENVSLGAATPSEFMKVLVS